MEAVILIRYISSGLRCRLSVVSCIFGLLTLTMIMADSVAVEGGADNVMMDSCDWINLVYEDKGEVRASFYESKPTLSPKVGDPASMVMYFFHQSRAINRVRLFYDGNQRTLFVGDAEHSGRAITQQNAICKGGVLSIESESELHSEGLSYHELKRMNFRRTANGSMEVQWEIVQLARPLIIFRQHFEMHGIVVFRPGVE